MAGVLGLVESGHLGTRYAAHHPGGHFEHGHLHAALASRRRHFEADVAAADDHEPPLGGTFGADAVGVGDGAQIVHTGELAPGDEQATRTAAGGEQQRVVRQDQAVIEPHVSFAARNVGHPLSEMRRDRMLGKESRRPDEETLALEAAGEVLLRERRPLVRRPRIITDEGQLSRKAPATQRVDCLYGGLASSHDHDPLVHPAEG